MKSPVRTIRLTEEDLKAIKIIQDHYGATSITGAIRLAVRQTARRAIKSDNTTPPKIGGKKTDIPS